MRKKVMKMWRKTMKKMKDDRVQKVMNILVNTKGVPAKIKKNQVYLLHWTIPYEDGMVGANRTSINLFKTLKSVAKYLVSETGISNLTELIDNFQADGEETSYVWDIIIEEVMK